LSPKRTARKSKKRAKTKPRSRPTSKYSREEQDINKALKRQEKKLLELSDKLDEMSKKEAIILKTLGLPKNPKRGDKGITEEFQQSIINLEEYLLNTTNRIDNILKALKTHREFLMRINRRVYKADTKGKLKIELDIMKNTLSILAMNGIDFDSSMFKEIEKLRGSIDDDRIKVSELKKRKEKLEQKFSVELKRFDLESIYNKRKILPGYV